ncbi:MAG TPA: hypothetical protein VLI90_14505 [Tepidisphaeraceae bacterium]|nr:hypothetical protein [Tepidisphaeraceae bacterium]
MSRHRRGGAYILVLGVAMLVTVIGMAALMTTRLAAREANSSTDWEEAGTLAQAAVEHAISYLNAKVTANPTGWRAAFTSYTPGSGVYAFTQSAGRGTFNWAVKDEVDGNFSNNYVDPFRLYGIGKVGLATRVYSVQIVPAGSPLDVLRCAVHANGNVTQSGVICCGSNAAGYTGPLSSNAKISFTNFVYGNVEAVTTSGANSLVKGTLTTPAAVKTMPSPGVYNLYLNKATVIPWSALSNSIAPGLLSSTYNPYGTTNPDGVYSITVPAAQSLTISSSRIKGTLLISMSGGSLNLTGPILWEPNRTDFPILIINGSGVSVSISGSTTWLSESAVGMDLDGDNLTTHDLPPQYRGLIHIIGSTNTVMVSNNAYIRGLLLTDGALSTSGQTTFVSDSTLYTKPPIGYGLGDQLMIVPGSWVWDSTP